jgi:hypothetical protein
MQQKAKHEHKLKDIPFDKAKPVYIIGENNEIQEAYILPRSLEKEPIEKHRENLYIVFLILGIVSFALGSLISYKRLNGGSKNG